MKNGTRSIEILDGGFKVHPRSDQGGGEFQEREVHQEEKEELSDDYNIRSLSRKYQEIIDNYGKRLVINQPSGRNTQLY